MLGARGCMQELLSPLVSPSFRVFRGWESCGKLNEWMAYECTICWTPLNSFASFTCLCVCSVYLWWCDSGDDTRGVTYWHHAPVNVFINNPTLRRLKQCGLLLSDEIGCSVRMLNRIGETEVVRDRLYFTQKYLPSVVKSLKVRIYF